MNIGDKGTRKGTALFHHPTEIKCEWRTEEPVTVVEEIGATPDTGYLPAFVVASTIDGSATIAIPSLGEFAA